MGAGVPDPLYPLDLLQTLTPKLSLEHEPMPKLMGDDCSHLCAVSLPTCYLYALYNCNIVRKLEPQATSLGFEPQAFFLLMEKKLDFFALVNACPISLTEKLKLSFPQMPFFITFECRGPHDA